MNFNFESFFVNLPFQYKIWGILRKFKFKKPEENRALIVYSPKESFLLFKNIPFQHLNHLEQLILCYLIENMEHYAPLQNINSIIEKETKTYSTSSIVRKRETTIKMLKHKLSLLLNAHYDDIILEQKNKYDKRLKEIRLNNLYFKVLD